MACRMLTNLILRKNMVVEGLNLVSCCSDSLHILHRGSSQKDKAAACRNVHTKCRQLIKNTVQALKYPWADAVTLYMPGFKAIN